MNRTALARSLDASAAQIAAGLRAGEVLGLCHVRPNGRIAWESNGHLLEEPQTSLPPSAAITSSPKDERPAPERIPPRVVLAEFATQWEASPLYRQRYIFTAGRDHRLAAPLGSVLTLPDLKARIALYLTHPNACYTQCAHAFHIFASHVNEFIPQPDRATGRRVMDATATRDYLRRQRGDHDDTVRRPESAK